MENISVFRLEEAMALSTKEFVVYTCLKGVYEKPVKKNHLEENIQYICFSGNEASVSDVWEFRSTDDLHLLND